MPNIRLLHGTVSILRHPLKYYRLSIYHIQRDSAHSPKFTVSKLRLNFALMNDTPYLALPGKLWGVFGNLFKEKWPSYIKSALYRDSHYKDKMVSLPCGYDDVIFIRRIIIHVPGKTVFLLNWDSGLQKVNRSSEMSISWVEELKV